MMPWGALDRYYSESQNDCQVLKFFGFLSSLRVFDLGDTVVVKPFHVGSFLITQAKR